MEVMHEIAAQAGWKWGQLLKVGHPTNADPVFHEGHANLVLAFHILVLQHICGSGSEINADVPLE